MSSVRITDVRTVLLTGPSTDDPWLTQFKRQRSAAFIEIHTDTELIGIGETYVGYFFPESVPLVVDYLRPILVDADTTDVPTLCRRMRLCCAYWGRIGLGAAVVAGIEAALWDLAGKREGVPVYELLGGLRHDRLRAYATGGPSPWPIDTLLEKATFYLGLGYSAFKVASGFLDATTRREVSGDPVTMETDKVAALRRHLGSDVAILLDGHMGHRESAERWDLETAIAVLDAVAPYDIFFFEEPLPYTDLEGYAELTRRASIRVAGGEQLTTIEEFRIFARDRAFAIAQPDAAWIGLGEFVEVAALFDGIAPHAWGAGAAAMQNIHGGFAAANTVIVETPPAAGPLHTEIWGDSFCLRDGHLLPPTTPGLGITLSDAVKERFPFAPGMEEFASVPGKLMRS